MSSRITESSLIWVLWSSPYGLPFTGYIYLFSTRWKMSSLIMVNCFVSELSAWRLLAAEKQGEVHPPRIGHDWPGSSTCNSADNLNIERISSGTKETRWVGLQKWKKGLFVWECVCLPTGTSLYSWANGEIGNWRCHRSSQGRVKRPVRFSCFINGHSFFFSVCKLKIHCLVMYAW